MKYPKYLFRKDDGIRFTRQSNGKYTMDKSEMKPKYEYGFHVLFLNGFVDSIHKCKIEKFEYKNNGHGDID